MKHPILPVILLIAAVALPSQVQAKAPAGRFMVDAAGATVYDNATKLTWQRDVPSTYYQWGYAKYYCQNLLLAGGGWRLPWVSELLGIVDRQQVTPTIDPTAFPNTPATHFWSASPVQGYAYYAWFVDFYNGSTTSDQYVSNYSPGVRCVR